MASRKRIPGVAMGDRQPSDRREQILKTVSRSGVGGLAGSSSPRRGKRIVMNARANALRV